MRSDTGELSCTRSYPSSLLKIIVFCSETLISFAAQADSVQTNLVSDIHRVCGNYRPGSASLDHRETDFEAAAVRHCFVLDNAYRIVPP